MLRNQPWPSTPYSGEFHLTALRTPWTVRTMSASRRRPNSRFQPGMAAMAGWRGGVAVGLRDVRVAACEEDRICDLAGLRLRCRLARFRCLRSDPLGGGLLCGL